MQMMSVIQASDDNDSYFQVKEGHGLPPCETGDPVNCGDIIRLEHVNTSKNIHSHNFPSFITDSQEVCGFGQNGEGDENDSWEIQCYNQKENHVRGKTNFFLQHLGTKQYLYVNIKKSLFNEYNCRGCPIIGHREVSCTSVKDKQNLWKIVGGIIYNSTNDEEKDHVEVTGEKTSHSSYDL